MSAEFKVSEAPTSYLVERLLVPAGYKQTEVGVIPKDWGVKLLRDVVDFANGKPCEGKIDPDGQYWLITLDSISIEGKLKPEHKRTHFFDASLCKGDIVAVLSDLAHGKLLGLCDLIPEDNVYVLNQRMGRLRLNGPGVAQFIRLQINRRQEHFRQRGQGTSQRHVYRRDFDALPIPFPPTKAEQEAIAGALSDADELIALLERLIAKQRHLKQCAMQELLTGKKRLPGFQGEWKLKLLGDHLKFLNNGANSRAELMQDGRVKYLHYGDIHGAQGLLLNPGTSVMPFLPVSKAERLDRLKDGDLVFADASEDIDGVGKSVELQGVGDWEVVSGMHTIAVRFDKSVLADGFKAYLQLIPAFRNHLRRLAAGTKVYATNMSHIASAELNLPTTDEQEAISAVLSDMDAEIAALAVRLAKTRDIKQGMMQELLTGRVRLIKTGSHDER